MRLPSHLLQPATFRSEPMMAAMAAIAVGMFLGTWVLGPAITYKSPDAPAQAVERTTLQTMLARPDPMPYRAPTPSFDQSGPPNYAAIAKEKARAESGGPSDGDWFDATSGIRVSRPYRARAFDRHRFY